MLCNETYVMNQLDLLQKTLHSELYMQIQSVPELQELHAV